MATCRAPRAWVRALSPSEGGNRNTMDVSINGQESIAPRQGTRLITATRRREMAEERARILGRRRVVALALEVAAAQWEREREARGKEGQGEKPRPSRATEMYPFSLQRVSLRIKETPPDDDSGWKASVLPQKKKPRRRRLGGICVSSFATRLIQRERAGGSRGGIGPQVLVLEEAARRWEEQRKAGNPRR